jgi:sigma-E factor negative regulatory protein RseC
MELSEHGIIEKTDGRSAWVRVERSSACASCPSRSECKVELGKGVLVEVENSAGCRPGDRVRLSMGSGSFLKSTLVAYIFPVVALVAGALAGSQLVPGAGLSGDAASVFTGFGAMALYFVVLKLSDRSGSRTPWSPPRITAIIKRSSDSD